MKFLPEFNSSDERDLALVKHHTAYILTAIFFRGIFDSSPIEFGYIPIAFTFGLTALQANLPPLTAIAISAFIFAGASQFVLITLFSAGASILNIRVTGSARALLVHFG